MLGNVSVSILFGPKRLIYDARSQPSAPHRTFGSESEGGSSEHGSNYDCTNSDKPEAERCLGGGPSRAGSQDAAH
jgi:hypothetical protein